MNVLTFNDSNTNVLDKNIPGKNIYIQFAQRVYLYFHIMIAQESENMIPQQNIIKLISIIQKLIYKYWHAYVTKSIHYFIFNTIPTTDWSAIAGKIV